jgi:hypothetical protein
MTFVVAMPLPWVKRFDELKSLYVLQRLSHPFSSNKLITAFLLMDAKLMSSRIRRSDEMYALTLAMYRDNSTTLLTVWAMLLANALRIMVKF